MPWKTPLLSRFGRLLISARAPALAARLREAGIGPVDLREQVRPRVVSDDVLIERLAALGGNTRLGLTGRPRRRLLGLATACLIDSDDTTLALVPAVFDTRSFLLGRDVELLVHEMRTSLGYLARHAVPDGRPLFVVPIAEWMLADEGGEALLAFCRDELMKGRIDDVAVRLAHLDDLVPDARRLHLPGRMARWTPPEAPGSEAWQRVGDVAALEHQLGESPSPQDLMAAYGESRALDERLVLLQRLGRAEMPAEQTFPDADGALRDRQGHLVALFRVAQHLGAWREMRLAAEQAGIVDAFLEVALMDLVVHQKRLAVGRSYTRDAVIDEPVSNREILRRIAAYCDDDARERALTQELVIHLGAWLRAEPALFDDVITLRTGPLLKILVALQGRETATAPAQALDDLVAMPPHELRDRLREAIAWRGHPERLEALHRHDATGHVSLNRPSRAAGGAGEEEMEPVDWYHRRELDGAMSRLPEGFYRGVWALLGHVPALVIGNRYDRRSILDSQLYRGQSTAGEHNFALAVEHRLQRIEAPEYRQLCIEALATLTEIVADNPSLSISEPLVLDVLIGHAVRLAWLGEHPEDKGRYDERRSDAWQFFYRRPPRVVAGWITAALNYLLRAAVQPRHETEERTE